MCTNNSLRVSGKNTLKYSKTLKYWVGIQQELALAYHPSSDGITMKIPYEVGKTLCLPYQLVFHPIFSYCVS